MPISYQVHLFGCFTGISQLCMICVHTQLWLTLCNPMDCGPPGSSVHGIIPARILESVAISSSRESFWPGDQTCISGIGRQILYHEPPEKPISQVVMFKKKKKKKKAITLSLLFSMYIPHQSMTTHLPSLPSRKLSTIPDSAHSSPFLNPVCTRSLSPNKLSLVFQIASDFLPQLPLLKYLPFDVMH